MCVHEDAAAGGSAEGGGLRPAAAAAAKLRAATEARLAAAAAAVRHPGLQLKIPAWVFCMSWCPDFEFRGTQAERAAKAPPTPVGVGTNPLPRDRGLPMQVWLQLSRAQRPTKEMACRYIAQGCIISLVPCSERAPPHRPTAPPPAARPPRTRLGPRVRRTAHTSARTPWVRPIRAGRRSTRRSGATVRR